MGTWQARVERVDQSVETLELHSGVRLVLSRFDPGQAHAFTFTEPADMFGFGFHLQGGARFRVETARFETSAADVWACATPRGARSSFALPSHGFRTVSIRFEPGAAEAYFEGGLALPPGARELLNRASETTGVARLSPMKAHATARLSTMFTTGYGGTARRLYLESCALDLLAGQLESCGRADRCFSGMRPHHRERALAARQYLDHHFRDPPTISELARIVGTNEFTLKRAFKEVFGTTLFAHVSQRRMERAEILLRQGMTVSMTAREVGYECVRSFSAAFRRYVGHPPSLVRRGPR